MQFFTKKLFHFWKGIWMCPGVCDKGRRQQSKKNVTKTPCLALLFSISLGHGMAQTNAPAINLDVKDASIEEVFNLIKKQSGYQFWYKPEELKNAKKITLTVKNGGLEETLKKLFKGQPFSYNIVNQTIVVSPNRDDEFVPYSFTRLQDVTLHGIIKDTNGVPLRGASVRIKGSDKATLTDNEGKFRLTKVTKEAVLEISYVGYESKQIDVTNVTNTNGFLDIALEGSTSELDQVQVIAYGTTTQRYATGNVGTISSKEIERQPVNNPLLALTARIPGLTIVQSSGIPGAGVTVRLQGTNSLNSGNDPLYVIDGVPFVSQMLQSTSFVMGSSGGASVNGVNDNGYGSPLSYLNPADIENISILKDADATAIYGSRAANGAILITTKKGRAGETRVSVNFQNGWGKVPKRIDLLNSQQYLQLRREAKQNDNAAIAVTDYDINGFWDTTRYTDWQKVLIGGTAQYRDAQLSFSGGNTNTQFNIGAGYHRETTVFMGDFNDSKASLHFNITNSSNDQRLKVQLTGSYLNDNNNLNTTDFTSNIYLAPTAPPLRLPDGAVNWMQNASGTSTWTNPLGPLDGKYKINGRNLIANSLVSYKILPSLEIKSSFGFNLFETDEINQSPITVNAPEVRATTARRSSFGNNSISSWIIEPQLNYHQNINKGKLDVLIGGTFNKRLSKRQFLLASGFNSDEVLDNIAAATQVTVSSTINSIYAYNSAFGRINYNYDNKYLLNITVRRDGSSRFGNANRYHNFGAIGLGWIFSESKWIKDKWRWLNFGKLRGSFGTTGNDQIGDYQYLSLYNPITTGVAYQGISSLTARGIPNPYIQWEETKKLQFGVDLGFLKDIFLLNANYYRNRSSNQLLNYPLPQMTGFAGIITNVPAKIQNSGWEFTLNANVIRSHDFHWTSSVNLTIPRNKLISFPGIENSTYLTLIVGQSVLIQRINNYAGVDPLTGRYIFTDKNGQITNTPAAADKPAFIDPSPKYYGGFQNSLTYKSVQLDFLFQFTNQIAQNFAFGRSGFVGARNSNQPVTVLDRWQKPGDIAGVQKYSVSALSDFEAINSNAGYSDASFVRLKNISLSYLLPQRFQQKLHLQNSRLFTQAQNLFTITKYQGLDPETKSLSSLPTLRVVTVGIQVGF